jgi:hypothetical protein
VISIGFTTNEKQGLCFIEKLESVMREYAGNWSVRAGLKSGGGTIPVPVNREAFADHKRAVMRASRNYELNDLRTNSASACIAC